MAQQTNSRAQLNRLVGRQNTRRGDTHELSIDHANRVYRTHGLAFVQKMPIPTRYGGADRKGPIFRPIRAAGYDYAGHFGPNAGPRDNPGAWFGLAIAMEAKSTVHDESHLLISEGTRRAKGMPKATQGGIAEHQLESLVDAMHFGAVSAVVWHNAERRCILLPDQVLAAWERFRTTGERKIPAGCFQTYELGRYPSEFMVDDWLYPLRCWLELAGRPKAENSKLRCWK